MLKYILGNKGAFYEKDGGRIVYVTFSIGVKRDAVLTRNNEKHTEESLSKLLEESLEKEIIKMFPDTDLFALRCFEFDDVEDALVLTIRTCPA